MKKRCCLIEVDTIPCSTMNNQYFWKVTDYVEFENGTKTSQMTDCGYASSVKDARLTAVNHVNSIFDEDRKYTTSPSL